MRKQIVAFLAALLITGIIALSMFVIGANAVFNPNGTSISNSPASAAAKVATNSTTGQADVAQLQNLVAQYQAREQQYQAALQTDNQQLNQAAQEMQMVQQLLLYLQNRGVIQIDSQGQIIVTAGGSGN